jgi:transcriptional regulator with XRE-family HTH domain
MNHASSLREPRSRKRRTTADDAVIGQTLRALRLDRGLSQSELGHAAGVTFQQLQKYEKGTNRVSAARLARIAAALNVPVTAFYGAARARAVASPDGLPYLQTRGAIRLARAYADISRGSRAALVTLGGGACAAPRSAHLKGVTRPEGWTGSGAPFRCKQQGKYREPASRA